MPLGAGGRFVRFNGKAYEALVAAIERRPAEDLYHSALLVRVPEGRFAIEQTPAGSRRQGPHGVVASGAVGTRPAGRLRIFRYEIRRWHDGEIPDIEEAVDSPRRLTADEAVARRVLESAAEVPTPVWGRDELRAGEMWNSNSVIAWILSDAGIDAGEIRPPPRGRAPGWRAGVIVAGRPGGDGS